MSNTNPMVGGKKALIISVSDYNSLDRLDFCKNDGREMSKLLRSIGYEIKDADKLIGKVNGSILEDEIIDFFSSPDNRASDTLLFYYSGHGVPDVGGDMYLASSDIDPNLPDRRGFSFERLTKTLQRTASTRVIVVLDCCYSGMAGLSKGHEDDQVKLGTIAIKEKSNKLDEGEGRCLLAASQSYQEAYAHTEKNHSLFTYYLLEGLKGGGGESIDNNGNVTPDTLGRYIYHEIMNLDPDKRPKQAPIKKVEASGDIILASYPELRKENRLSPQPMIPAEAKGNKSRKRQIVILGILAAIGLIGMIVAVNNIASAEIRNKACFSEYDPPATSCYYSKKTVGSSNATVFVDVKWSGDELFYRITGDGKIDSWISAGQDRLEFETKWDKMTESPEPCDPQAQLPNTQKIENEGRVPVPGEGYTALIGRSSVSILFNSVVVCQTIIHPPS